MIEYITPCFAGLTVGSTVTWFFRRKIEQILILTRYLKNKPIDKDVKMVLVVRRDLDLSPGKLASQCAHAAVTCFSATQKYNPEIAKFWESRGQPKIVLRCNSETDFSRLQSKATSLKLISVIVQDAGRTHLIPGTKTVLGIGPGAIKDVDQVTGNLKLY